MATTFHYTALTSSGGYYHIPRPQTSPSWAFCVNRKAIAVPGKHLGRHSHPPRRRSDLWGSALVEDLALSSLSHSQWGGESVGWPPSAVCVIMTANRVNLVCSRFRQSVLCVWGPFLKHTDSDVAVWKIINLSWLRGSTEWKKQRRKDKQTLCQNERKQKMLKH